MVWGSRRKGGRGWLKGEERKEKEGEGSTSISYRVGNQPQLLHFITVTNTNTPAQSFDIHPSATMAAGLTDHDTLTVASLTGFRRSDFRVQTSIEVSNRSSFLRSFIVCTMQIVEDKIRSQEGNTLTTFSFSKHTRVHQSRALLNQVTNKIEMAMFII